jgi:hypothetical protein
MRNDANAISSHPAPPEGGATLRWWLDWFKRPHRQAALALKRRLKSGLVLDRETGCWLWSGGGVRPYGLISTGTHRLAWELANGPIPDGMQVLHRCDEPRCCNPDHLFLGTQSDNMADKVRKGRTRNGYTGKIKAPRRRSRPRAQPAGGKT